mmetsp:Transcript_41521/g.96930  ORF Transcript_41521/g.96930 Transcript_41521/m.96930 type:complete len:774 (+) Transcript_41521:686-3007(+)
MLFDLDIGAVVGADDDAAVHHKLHVGRAGRLGTRRGDVLRDVVGGNDDLRVANLVVGDEDELQVLRGVGVVVDDGADSVCERNDLLGHKVPGGRLAPDEAGALDNVLALVGRHALDRVVAVDDLKDVEELALVLVDALDLDVKHGVGVDVDVHRLLDVLGEALLVLELRLHQLVENLVVRLKLVEAVEEGEVLDPLVGPEALGDERVERGVALRHPAAARDAVGDADELVVDALALIELDKVGEDVGLDNVGVDGSHTVDLEGANNGEVGHADHLVVALTLNDRQLAHHLPLVAHRLLYLVEPPPVDLEDDLHHAGKQRLHQRHGPLLEGLGEHRVVGVGKDFLHDRPGSRPAEAVAVDEEAHELSDTDGRVRVVELHRNLGGKLVHRAAGLGGEEGLDHVLKGGRDKEVLLLQAELLAGPVVVVGVENLGDLEGALAGGEGLVVVTLVELAEVNVLVGHGGPEAEGVGVERVVAGDGGVVGDSDNLLRAVEGDRVRDVKALDLPGVAVRQPRVGELDLDAILDALLEHTVLITDTVAPSRQVEGGHRVEEAGGEAAEATVAEGCVLLLVDHVLEVVPNLLKSSAVGLLEVEVHEGVEERATHEELEGQVVDTLGILLDVVGLGVTEGLNKVVADRERDGVVGGTVIEVVAISGEGVLDVVHDRALDRLLVHRLVSLGELPNLLLLGVLAAGTRPGHVRAGDLLLRRRAGHLGGGGSPTKAHDGGNGGASAWGSTGRIARVGERKKEQDGGGERQRSVSQHVGLAGSGHLGLR